MASIKLLAQSGSVAVPGVGPQGSVGPAGPTGLTGSAGPQGEGFPSDYPVVETEAERDSLYGTEVAGFYVLVTEPTTLGPNALPHFFRLVTPGGSPGWTIGIPFAVPSSQTDWRTFSHTFLAAEQTFDIGGTAIDGPILLFRGGVLQQEGVHYTVAGTIITMDDPQPAGMVAYGVVTGPLSITAADGEDFEIDAIVDDEAARDSGYGAALVGTLVLVNHPESPLPDLPHLFRLEISGGSGTWSPGSAFGSAAGAEFFSFTGDGVTATFGPLPFVPVAADKVDWFEDTVIQTPGVDFDLDTVGDVVRAEAPALGAKIMGRVHR